MATSEVSFRGSDMALAHALLRGTIGMNIMMHGLARLLSGEDKFVASVVTMFQGSPLPYPLVHGFAILIPWIEATIGILVLSGFLLRWALAAGAILITVLTFGVTSRQNWNTAGEQLTYAIVFALLLASIAVDRYSVDALLRRKA